MPSEQELPAADIPIWFPARFLLTVPHTIHPCLYEQRVQDRTRREMITFFFLLFILIRFHPTLSSFPRNVLSFHIQPVSAALNWPQPPATWLTTGSPFAHPLISSLVNRSNMSLFVKLSWSLHHGHTVRPEEYLFNTSIALLITDALPYALPCTTVILTDVSVPYVPN